MTYAFLLHSIKKTHDFGKDMLAMSDMQKMPLSLAQLLLKFSLQMPTFSGTASQILLFHKEINRIFYSFVMNLIF